MLKPAVLEMMKLSKKELIYQIESSMNRIKPLLSDEDRKVFETLIPGSEKHINVNLINWSGSDKELVWLNALRGVYYYNFILFAGKSLDFSSYNSIKSSMNGSDEIWLYSKGLKWYPESIRIKIKEQGHVFEELIPRTRTNYSEESKRGNYSEYGGPSDGYGGYLDDDFINDVLDGDPSAIWNLD